MDCLGIKVDCSNFRYLNLGELFIKSIKVRYVILIICF